MKSMMGAMLLFLCRGAILGSGPLSKGKEKEITLPYTSSWALMICEHVLKAYKLYNKFEFPFSTVFVTWATCRRPEKAEKFRLFQKAGPQRASVVENCCCSWSHHLISVY